ncbi:putative ALA-interacting subunit 2 isoform X1 [Cucumis sativus]|uniref:ALA-interacting subunit n=2 Tax=Cucumis sativus TaxID=3659 RepID=A0A0A0KKQ5_CUCSA|nr:putative ALA-interacting subunit 2 isoform X1 [Cucumis sativus]KGN49419.1 hypothetical protein Csa_004237 [Cucumis sativus]
MKSMDLDGSSSLVASEGSGSVPAGHVQARRHTAYYRFTQQSLPACKPVLTPTWVISIFLLMGIIFVPVGFLVLHTSHSVAEIVYRYDTECVPVSYKNNMVAYIKDSSVPKLCSFSIKVNKTMKAPIYIYYQLDNYYQNHRRYVKSRSDKQLLHGLAYNDTSSCKPLQSHNGLPIVPCGLIAWSLFNDTYRFVLGKSELKVDRKNIAWASDREHKFGKHVYPFNFQNGSLIGGGNLDRNIPLSDHEDLIVWMRTAALPSFRKLYGRIEEDLHADDVLDIKIMNNYNTYSFGGTKKLVISTSSWLGGRNDFLGCAYIFLGSSSLLVSIFFTLLHMKSRPFREINFSSRNKGSSTD